MSLELDKQHVGELAHRAAAHFERLLENEAKELSTYLKELAKPNSAGSDGQIAPQKLVIKGRSFNTTDENAASSSSGDGKKRSTFDISVDYTGSSSQEAAAASSSAGSVNKNSTERNLGDYEAFIESVIRPDNRTINGSFAVVVPLLPSKILQFVRWVAGEFSTAGSTDESLLKVYGSIVPQLKEFTDKLVHLEECTFVRWADPEAGIATMDIKFALNMKALQKQFSAIAGFLDWVSDLQGDAYEDTPPAEVKSRRLIGRIRFHKNTFTCKAFIKGQDVIYTDPETKNPWKDADGNVAIVPFDVHGTQRYHVHGTLVVAVLRLGPVVFAQLTLPYLDFDVKFEGSSIAKGDGTKVLERAVWDGSIKEVGPLFPLYAMFVPMGYIRDLLKDLCKGKIVLLPEGIHRSIQNGKNETPKIEDSYTGDMPNYILLLRGTITFPRTLVLDLMQDIMMWLVSSSVIIDCLTFALALATAIAADMLV